MSNWQHDGEVRTPEGGYEPRREQEAERVCPHYDGGRRPENCGLCTGVSS